MTACFNAAPEPAPRFPFDAADSRRRGISDVEHADADGRLHLEVRVVHVEERDIEASPAVHRFGFQAALIAPGPFRRKPAAGLRRRWVEAAALETSRRRDIRQRTARQLHLD